MRHEAKQHVQAIFSRLLKTTGTCWRWNTRPHEAKLKLCGDTNSKKVAVELV